MNEQIKLSAVTFTAEQVQEIINTIGLLPGQKCYDTLRMIEITISEQAKKEQLKNEPPSK